MNRKQRSIEADLEQVSGTVLTPVRWVVLLGILASIHLHFGLQRVHRPALWWNHSSQRLESVGRHGPILGLLPEWSAPTERWQLAPGDALILYTDGVLNAKTGPHERLGEERLAELLGQRAPESAQEWIERLRHALNDCVEWPDDVTAVAIQREPARARAAGMGRGNHTGESAGS